MVEEEEEERIVKPRPSPGVVRRGSMEGLIREGYKRIGPKIWLQFLWRKRESQSNIFVTLCVPSSDHHL